PVVAYVEDGGGEGSGAFQSGYGMYGGSGGVKGATDCQGTAPVLHVGNDGAKGEDGYRNAPGRGGLGGETPVPVKQCDGLLGLNGSGGGGGHGAGNQGDFSGGHQEPSTAGKNGKNGCVVLTYTA
ncbi:hypothetical protein JHN61_28530, partial [Streptomyces sp. MBT67]|nr:hypothetical protein [Streptomyces sp. MBT67]